MVTLEFSVCLKKYILEKQPFVIVTNVLYSKRISKCNYLKMIFQEGYEIKDKFSWLESYQVSIKDSRSPKLELKKKKKMIPRIFGIAKIKTDCQ